MRPCKVPFKRPRRLTMDELNRLYLAARHMKKPIRDVSVSAFWWQALLVVAYNTGLRAGDLLDIRWENLNTYEQTLYVKVQKTGVDADLPLHSLTMAHLSRIPQSSVFIFDINRRYLYELWGLLRKQAGVRCGLHDIRRTACSEIDRVDRGLGKTLLLHAPGNVTEKSYLNSVQDLRPAIEKMEWPLAFKHGVKMAVRSLKKAQQAMLSVDDFAMPVHPPKDAFRFPPGGFQFMGKFYPVHGNCLALIKTLAEKGGKASQPELWAASDHRPFPETALGRKRLYIRLLQARRALRKHLQLPEEFNPIVPTSKFKSAELRDYELFLPPAIWGNMSNN
ncbi:tyrosine-type recombinase/integrase [Planctomicrobium sp. SH668]|uniref:tyrosine-type recombinase/integrase n=1 Tax=Planctomicrobium sp. SH668 TaxID=3448126 RepID=UPI003F5B7AC1